MLVVDKQLFCDEVIGVANWDSSVRPPDPESRVAPDSLEQQGTGDPGPAGFVGAPPMAAPVGQPGLLPPPASAPPLSPPSFSPPAPPLSPSLSPSSPSGQPGSSGGLPAPMPSATQAPSQDVSGAVTSVIIRYIRAKGGEQGLARVLSAAGERRSPSILEEPTTWSSHDQVLALLRAAQAVLRDPNVPYHVGEELLRQHEGTELATVLRSLGSPGELLRNVARAAVKFYTVSSLDPLEVGEAHAVVRAITRPGVARTIEMCDFTKGLLSQVPTLFDLLPATITETECQARGGRFCLYSLGWQERQWSQFVDERSSLFTMAWGNDQSISEARFELDNTPEGKLARMKMRMDAMAARLEGVFSTAADLLANDNLDQLLENITSRAGQAVNAPRYLLTARTHPLEPWRIHYQGMSQAEAQRLAEVLQRPESPPVSPSEIVVEIASSRNRYGRMAALYPAGMEFFEQEHKTLALYANYAAAALDVVTALEEARRSDATARLLLRYSRNLAAIGTTGEVAYELAQAIPGIIGCDSSSVLLMDESLGGFTVVARYPQDEKTPIANPVIKPEEHPILQKILADPGVVVVDHTIEDEALRRMLIAGGASVSVIAPIRSGEEAIGFAAANYRGPSDPAGSLRRAAEVKASREVNERLSGLADQASVAFLNARLLEQVTNMAWHDALTGLVNRRRFQEKVEEAFSVFDPEKDHLALLFVDLDRFKHVNDTLGHDAGDELIRQVAKRLSQAVRREDLVARLGGDEFAVLSPSLGDENAISMLAKRMLERLNQPYDIFGTEVIATASIGAAIAPEHGTNYDALLKHADTAMYRSKHGGRNTFTLFVAGRDLEEGADQIELEASLRRAVGRGEMELVYLPVVEINTGKVAAVEALSRWNHPQKGVLEPEAFLALAEDIQVLEDLDRWVLSSATARVSRWVSEGLGPLWLAVNVSWQDLQRRQFIDVVHHVLEQSGLPAQRLFVEITDKVLESETAEIDFVVKELHEDGVNFVLDDFGKGGSSLARLGSFPVNTVKIDRDLVSAIDTDRVARAVVRGLIQTAYSLDLACVAEGVEREAQAKVLLEEGCVLAQGYFFAPPLSSEDVASYVRLHGLVEQVAADVHESGAFVPKETMTAAERLFRSE